jgi:hypothetical protein
MVIRNKARLDSLLLIGSTARKAGKTTLACKIIEKFDNKKIIAIKIASIGKTDNKHRKELDTHQKGFFVTEETLREANKDTSRMLAAGAKKVFLIYAKSEVLKNAIEYFLGKMPKKIFFICESNSLRKATKPALFIMVEGKGRIKPSASKVLKYADIKICKSEFNNLLQNLTITRGKWMIKKG